MAEQQSIGNEANEQPAIQSSAPVVLPDGALAQESNHVENIAEASAYGRLGRRIGYAGDPIGAFNKLNDTEKQSFMKELLLGYGRFFHEGGVKLAPADVLVYAERGMPDTDRALMRGARLSTEHPDRNREGGGESARIDAAERETVHGKPCWPPNTAISGSTREPVRMDDAGRVDLLADPYCLRKHFTTRWAVLDDPNVWLAPQRGAEISWEDTNCIVVTGGEHAGLGVDTSELEFDNMFRTPHGPRTSLAKLISTHLLLYRITASFAAPPCTLTDQYKCSWSFSLWHRDDPTCSLLINEHKGRPAASFLGSQKASNEALQLLEWLTGTNCPHSYDYTPCGRHA